MCPQLQIWIQAVKDRLHETEMPKRELADICGVSKSTISELLRYGKGSDNLKSKVAQALAIKENWK